MKLFRKEPDVVCWNCAKIFSHKKIKWNPRKMATPTDGGITVKLDTVATPNEIFGFLNEQVKKASGHRIPRNRIAIDPGIGFGKTVKHNLQIIHHLDCFSALGVPVLLGPSRKSFIGEVLNLPPSERLEGTVAAAAISVFSGAHILRVHDISALVRVVRMADAIRKVRISC